MRRELVFQFSQLVSPEYRRTGAYLPLSALREEDGSAENIVHGVMPASQPGTPRRHGSTEGFQGDEFCFEIVIVAAAKPGFHRQDRCSPQRANG